MWRHPSEAGQHDRLRSSIAPLEPPAALGRGLAAATGVLSIVMGVVLLLTLIPTHTGRSATQSATPPVDPVSLEQLLGDDTATTNAPGVTRPVVVVPTEPTVPIELAAMPTYLVESEGGPDDRSPVAIAIDDGALIITTAAAVGDAREVSLTGVDGTEQTARVLFVDETSQLAVLVPDADTSLAGVNVASSVEPGDLLVAPGHSDEPVVVDRAEEVAEVASAIAVDANEGQPVLNQRGELVALCTRTGEGSVLLMLDRVADLRRTLGALLRPTVWIGVLVDDQIGGGLVVSAIDPDGPAAAAGIEPGERILAIDEVTVVSTIELAGVLAVHRVGDEISITLAAPDGTLRSVSVELASPPARL
jgi:S1-C subfamily serine protease